MLRYSLIPALLSTAALAVPIEHGSALLARGLSINPNKPASDTLQNDPWPTGKLNWCLQDVSQEETFLDLWSDAYTLWDNAWGDSSPTLRVPVYGGACSDQVNVNLVLAITITNTQSAATTVGYNNAIGGSNTMSIDTSNTWGYFDSAVNLAHEVRGPDLLNFFCTTNRDTDGPRMGTAARTPEVGCLEPRHRLQPTTTRPLDQIHMREPSRL